MDVENIQLQIKAFNKALSRADKAGSVSDEVYATISDLIDPARMTKGGYGKAGKKYLESMTPEELLSYSADISEANTLLQVDTLSMKLDLEDVQDPKGLLWRMFQKLKDNALGFDSDYVHAVEIGTVNIGYREMVLKMHKYLTDADYGLSDFDEWFNSKATLE